MPTGDSSQGNGGFRRTLDYAYLGFFALHIVIMFAVDFVGLYPPEYTPSILQSLREYYIHTYQDKFFTSPPIWFNFYIALEVVYHVPLSIWAVGALSKSHPMVPVHLLVWSLLTFITTTTSLFEVWGWHDRSEEQKWNISLLYAPYAAFAGFMALDMYYRLQGSLLKAKRD